jgi:hypothetical protein
MRLIFGRAVDQAVSLQTFYSGEPGSILSNPSEICDGQSGFGGFSPSTSVSPVSTIPSLLRTQLHVHVALTRRINGRSMGPFHKATLSTFEMIILKIFFKKLGARAWNCLKWLNIGSNYRFLNTTI